MMIEYVEIKRRGGGKKEPKGARFPGCKIT